MDSVEDERGKIPNLIKIGAIQSDTAMDMDQEVLDPVINNDNFCRFVLSNKGFLHSFSKITLGLNSTSTSGITEATFPSNIGVHSLIQRCALRIGTTIVAETDDFNYWMGYKSLFIDNDINKERETYLTSRVIAHDFVYDEVDLNNASRYGLNTNLEYDPVVGNLDPQKELQIGNGPVFQVSVADLFPFLRFNQLPLYMIDQQISIELHFSPSADLHRCSLDNGTTSGELFTIDTTQTKFVASYIYYDGELMSKYRDQNPVLEWTYNDYRLNKRSYADTTLEQEQILDVGGAGRIVSKVITALEKETATPDKQINNSFEAHAPDVNNNNNGLFTTNLIYNDHRLYPIDRSNPSLHFHDLVQAEQNIPHIARQEFNKQGGGLTVSAYNGNSQSSSTAGLNGKFHYIAYRPNRNERVNSKGIQLQLQYSELSAGTYLHRTWLELVKTATLDRGMFSTDFS
jgi:hypothetical protein